MQINLKNKKYVHTKNTSRKKTLITIDPKLLLTQRPAQEPVNFISDQLYSEMTLHPQLKKNLQHKGYERPTEIQEKAITELIKGRDMIGIASTGTGKTAAFLIPVIERLLAGDAITCLVVVPTRELAQQIQDDFKSLTLGMKYHSACFIGGTSVSKDMGIARKKPHLIIGTPGRLIDLVDRKALDLSLVSVLILDEFDRMLDMGFIQSIKAIISLAKFRKQTLLFSATINHSQQEFINLIVKNPLYINVCNDQNPSMNVEQNVLEIAHNEEKMDVLSNLLGGPAFEKVILFAETKRTVDKINKQLVRKGIKSDAIHGGKSQNYRSRAIQLFKTGQTRVLIATDVVSRGIDVQNVTHVINYQLPQTMEAYIHRIGRTGRAGKKGVAYTFIN